MVAKSLFKHFWLGNARLLCSVGSTRNIHGPDKFSEDTIVQDHDHTSGFPDDSSIDVKIPQLEFRGSDFDFPCLNKRYVENRILYTGMTKSQFFSSKNCRCCL